MYGTGNKKMLNMLILELLEEYSDENHRLTQQEIIRLLKLNYGMECDRRSVKNNILFLNELGYEISMEDGYYLMSKTFEDAELRLLIDSVLCSKNMTNIQAQSLIEKLKSQGNKYFSPKVFHVYNLEYMHHADNKQLYYVLDALNDAISEEKKVRFIYNSYDTDFKLKPKRQEKYIVSPYQMVVANGFYYLIGNYDKYDDISHYRLDKITYIEIMEDKAKPMKQVKGLERELNLSQHMAEHIYMFSGESLLVKIAVPANMMNELIDWFGKKFKIMSKSEQQLVIQVLCNRQAVFYWALQYGPFVEVLEPAKLRIEIKEAVERMYHKYIDEYTK